MRSRLSRSSLALVAPFFLVACGLVACGDEVTPIRCEGPSCSEPWLEPLEAPRVEKLDLLLALDNSRSMADKQALLASAVPDLVLRLVNPPCVSAEGAPPEQPDHPLDPCPAGTRRVMPPVLDIHIGVLSSSIGGHGADGCPDLVPDEKACAGHSSTTNTTNNDKGHLVARLDACGGAAAPTYEDRGFLAWDPAQTLAPPGEGDLVTLGASLRDMVVGVGPLGCEYESQLEGVYRFLVDPDPYASISVVANRATPEGTDTALLEQRKAFLRPDSMLAIVMLSDENDCSIKEYGQFYYVGMGKRPDGTDVRMPRAREECAIDPNDPCCKSCGQDPGSCPEEAACMGPDGQPAQLAPEEDAPNLRCWDQKRRFGIDFLYPVDRYVKAFSSHEIQDRAGNIVSNPIFMDLDPDDDVWQIRDPEDVFFAGIVGVPWQDVARDPTDLGKGLKNAAELAAPIDAIGATTWDVILGDPTKYVRPLDPLMIESVEKRTGTNPITGAALVDANAPQENPINGRERTIAGDDLQYTCIFPLPEGQARDCTDENLAGCDCKASASDNPLCAPNPASGGAPTLQVRAKAYPSLRQLAVLKGLGEQAVVASVCPASIEDTGGPGAGYRPAVDALHARMTAAFEKTCLPRSLEADAEGGVACTVFEARNVGGGACTCDPSEGRADVLPEHSALTSSIWDDPRAASEAWDCVCMMLQAEAGAARTACQEDVSDPPLAEGNPVHGWCYVDAATSPPLGNPELVSACPESRKRRIRFAGSSGDGAMFISCSGN
ncbi:hypothetical protein [Polyangium sp. y55x31]|uniref:hypothetical protein n=1 Tax=Polyangium sp. y55x31 TaxID=3042688 RepID=UPI00248306D9|nr:hypothetical protein [Polyangium sp. y55x31]MDI1484582.1 hypothetical protein [Polyangium sp. y55x31]